MSTVIICGVMLIIQFFLFRATSKKQREAAETLRQIDATRKVPVSVSVWKQYIRQLIEAERYEVCDRILPFIEGKPDTDMVSPPEHFYVCVNDEGYTISCAI